MKVYGITMVTVLFSTLISFTFQKDRIVEVDRWFPLGEGELFPILTEDEGWALATKANTDQNFGEIPSLFEFEFRNGDHLKLGVYWKGNNRFHLHNQEQGPLTYQIQDPQKGRWMEETVGQDVTHVIKTNVEKVVIWVSRAGVFNERKQAGPSY
ncbi:hypothetical protein PCASD_00183 [Puccinia coronata f. sp. avenae]|uniref:Uncharacterized protein n=1 Tax=Puccinia coronata f. sp. avenae TaxID=200324 RepID=A0A2N5VQF2_9BASI|nr:hypothetical protein PCASD_00183 [Puccinia coronata f. sp. avenae]